MENVSGKKTRHFVEAALFLSSEPLSIESLSKISGKTVEETRQALNELSEALEERDSSLEVRIEPIGVRFAVKKELEEFARNFRAVPELSKTVLKTLALIAYRQPIKQSEVIRIRNNKAYDHIGTLELKGFIRRESVGRTFIIYTTKKFIEYFGEPKTPPKQ